MFEICGINNDKIIEEIKKKAEKTNLEKCVSADNLQHDINIDRRWDIIRDISITSHRKLSGKVIVALKNKTMKFYKWYTDRLFDQQVEFNHLLWESFCSMKKEIAELKSEIEELKSHSER